LTEETLLEFISKTVPMNPMKTLKEDLFSSGAPVYIGLCPFHEELTPSFVVNMRTHHFYCLSCGEQGATKEEFVNLLYKRSKKPNPDIILDFVKDVNKTDRHLATLVAMRRIEVLMKEARALHAFLEDSAQSKEMH